MATSFRQPVLTPEAEQALGGPLSRSRTLQALWAGYGTCYEGVLADGRPVVIKDVRPPPGRGIGHERKLQSYENERAFYQTCAKRCNDAGATVPEPYYVRGEPAGPWLFVLSDLRADDTASPSREPMQQAPDLLDLPRAKEALAWLARLHAAFIGKPVPDGLWPEGSYWTLATRQDELRRVGGPWAGLRDAAAALDQRIRTGGPRPHVRTVIHGDPKSENLLCSPEGDAWGAVDFQYAGGGLGGKDVAYLFCSSVTEAVLEGHEAELLAHYHKELLSRCPRLDYPLAAFTEDYELCLLDYVRFMAGWGWWGSAKWARKRAQEAIAGGALGKLELP